MESPKLKECKVFLIIFEEIVSAAFSESIISKNPGILNIKFVHVIHYVVDKSYVFAKKDTRYIE